jgi:xanthine dehydrogenase small subunit
MTGIRFLLDGRVREIDGVDPNTTVLEWLRGAERRCGTKEGCAEGDCGACTVVVATPREAESGLDYRAVNACIQPIGTLDGKQLITVESLKSPDGALHPVQAAMVEHHASQCGFCTPGFVMSLFAYAHGDEAASREAAMRALAGNLCRCTGYRPILDAAEQVGKRTHADDAFARASEATARTLRGLARAIGPMLVQGARHWHAPRTLDELDALLAALPEPPVFVAGATDLGLEITKKHRRFERLVELGGIDALRVIVDGPTHLELGAAVSWSDAHRLLAAHWPTFDEFLARFAGRQIRNVATIGGNIANASPIGDGAPALLALDAEIVLWHAGRRRILPLDSFFLDYRRTALAPGEIIERIRVPKPSPGTRFAAYKVSKRFDSDISAVCGCLRIERDVEGRITGCGIAFGGMAAIPLRLRAVEALAIGREWTPALDHEIRDALAGALKPIDDLRASAAYRRYVATSLWTRFAAEARDGAPATRIRAYG